MIVRIAELEIAPAHLDRYRILLAEEIEASVAREAGVLALQAVSLKGELAQIRILEVYADQQAYEDHLQSPHFLSYKAATEGMVRALRLIETDPICLAVKGPMPDS